MALKKTSGLTKFQRERLSGAGRMVWSILDDIAQELLRSVRQLPGDEPEFVAADLDEIVDEYDDSVQSALEMAAEDMAARIKKARALLTKQHAKKVKRWTKRIRR